MWPVQFLIGAAIATSNIEMNECCPDFNQAKLSPSLQEGLVKDEEVPTPTDLGPCGGVRDEL
jgi:hypothetical protein